MMEKDALAYGRPYSESAGASEAVAATMNAVDWSALLGKVDDAYQRWRKPTVLLYGTADPFMKVSEAFQWLEDKVQPSKAAGRQACPADAKLGCALQEG